MKMVLVVCAITALSGCGSNGAFVDITDTNWATACGAEGNSRDSLAITKDTLTYAHSVADTANVGSVGCGTVDYTVTYVYSYTTGVSALGDTFKDEYDVFKLIDLTLTSVTFTPVSATVAADANTASFCGMTNWAANTAQEVLGVAGATYDNCGRNVDFGTYSVSAIGEARPFSVRNYTAAGDRDALAASTAVFSSFAGVFMNNDEQILRLAPANHSVSDGRSAADRTFDVLASSEYFLIPATTK